MPDALAAALSLDGAAWLAATAFVAGLVRGFAGFGTALIFLPVAALFLTPVWAVITLIMLDIIGPVPNLPRALREGNRRDLLRLGAGMLIGLPFGLALLFIVDTELFRYAVSGVALFLVLMLVMGLRYRGKLKRSVVFGTGTLAGFLGGSTGLTGPPVVLLYMAGPKPPAAIRANAMVFLYMVDVAILLGFLATGRLEMQPALLGLLLAVPHLLGNVAGAAMFAPDRERLYRAVGYLIIAASAVAGLPLWD